MGGSLHGGSVMSFIDMSMFAGGLCAGMERGHYVTLDLTTHFLARGRPGIAARCPCRTGQADPRPRFPPGRGQAERRALLQLQRDAEAHPRAQRAGMTGPVGAAYDELVAGRRVEARPGAGARGRRARPAGGQLRRAEAFSRLFGGRGDGPAGVYLWGGVGRGKSMLMDLAFAHIDVAAQAPRPFPRIHARNPRAAARRARTARRATRSSRSPRRSRPRRGCSCFDEMLVTNPADAMILSRLFGKLLGQGSRSSPPRTGRRAISTRTASTASCSCRSSR